MKRGDTGRAGENFAAQYLEDLGFRIVKRNARVGHLETDIIAADDKYILFTEVKTRRTRPDAPHPFGTPGSAVNAAKADRLIRAAEEYMRSNPDETVRIDVIEVYADPKSDAYRTLDIVHTENSVRKHGKFSMKKNRY